MLWKDNESDIDFLNFDYLVKAVTSIIQDDKLTPSTIGVYGDWGSGKSSLMKMVEKEIEGNEDYLCIDFNGWLFEGYDDAQSALCGTILDTLYQKGRLSAKLKRKARALLSSIDGKHLLSKGVKVGLDVLLTGGIGSLTEVTVGGFLNFLRNKGHEISEADVEEYLKKYQNAKDDNSKRKEIAKFKENFKEIFEQSEINHLVVFIDELDRCSPDTVLEIFEAMRLFLYTEGTTFVIGADERLMKFAIKSKYKDIPGNTLDISQEYLEKIIQYPIHIPQLDAKEVHQYITCLLLLRTDVSDASIVEATKHIGFDEVFNYEKAITYLNIQDANVKDMVQDAFALSGAISPDLAVIMKGNPRHCKRFLNAMFLRMQMAKSRDVSLNSTILAKLMLVEVTIQPLPRTHLCVPSYKDRMVAMALY